MALARWLASSPCRSLFAPNGLAQDWYSRHVSMGPDVADRLVGLLRCVHYAADATAIDSIATEDWPAVVRAASVHGISPYLYVKLADMGLWGLVPAHVISMLRDEYHRTSLANMKIYHELSGLLSCLAREHIPVLLLKGAYLARFVYAYEAMRPMEDVDFLVHPEHYAKAIRVLLAYGYERAHEEEHWDGINPIERHVAVTIRRGTTFELHRTFDLSPTATRATADEAFARAVRVAVDGAEAFAMSPEDLLLHVAMHASFQHGFALGVRVLCDVAVILERWGDSLDWDAVVRRARAWHADRGIWLTFSLAEELAGVTVPPEVSESLRPTEPAERFRAAARTRILEGKALVPTTSTTLTAFAAHGSLHRKLLTATRRLFPAPPELARLYHVPPRSPRVWLFYPVRIRDVLQRHFPTALRLLLGHAPTRALAGRLNEGTALREWLRAPSPTLDTPSPPVMTPGPRSRLSACPHYAPSPPPRVSPPRTRRPCIPPFHH